jgi:hypothetical protein
VGRFFIEKQRALKNVTISLDTNIYSYLETSSVQGSNLNLNVIRFYTTSVN